MSGAAYPSPSPHSNPLQAFVAEVAEALIETEVFEAKYGSASNLAADVVATDLSSEVHPTIGDEPLEGDKDEGDNGEEDGYDTTAFVAVAAAAVVLMFAAIGVVVVVRRRSARQPPDKEALVETSPSEFELGTMNPSAPAGKTRQAVPLAQRVGEGTAYKDPATGATYWVAANGESECELSRKRPSRTLRLCYARCRCPTTAALSTLVFS